MVPVARVPSAPRYMPFACDDEESPALMPYSSDNELRSETAPVVSLWNRFFGSQRRSMTPIPSVRLNTLRAKAV